MLGKQFEELSLFDSDEYHVDNIEPQKLTPSEWSSRSDIVWHGSASNPIHFSESAGFHAGSKQAGQDVVNSYGRDYLHGFRATQGLPTGQVFTDQAANEGENNLFGTARGGAGQAAAPLEYGRAYEEMEQGKAIRYVNEGEDPGSISYIFPRPERQLRSWREDVDMDYGTPHSVRRYRDWSDKGIINPSGAERDPNYKTGPLEETQHYVSTPFAKTGMGTQHKLNYGLAHYSFSVTDAEGVKETLGPGSDAFWGPKPISSMGKSTEKMFAEKTAINKGRAEHGLPQYQARKGPWGLTWTTNPDQIAKYPPFHKDEDKDEPNAPF